jgi:hypothetical protein
MIEISTAHRPQRAAFSGRDHLGVHSPRAHRAHVFRARRLNHIA